MIINGRFYSVSPEVAARVRRWYRMYRRHYVLHAARQLTSVDARNVEYYSVVRL